MIRHECHVNAHGFAQCTPLTKIQILGVSGSCPTPPPRSTVKPASLVCEVSPWNVLPSNSIWYSKATPVTSEVSLRLALHTPGWRTPAATTPERWSMTTVQRCEETCLKAQIPSFLLPGHRSCGRNTKSTFVYYMLTSLTWRPAWLQREPVLSVTLGGQDTHHLNVYEMLLFPHTNVHHTAISCPRVCKVKYPSDLLLPRSLL